MNRFSGYTKRYDIPHNTEWVETKVLWLFREYDRQSNLKKTAYFDKLAASIRRYGWVEPLMLIYYQDIKSAILGEGNHRLYAAYSNDIKLCPVRVVRNTQWRQGCGYTAVRVPGFREDSTGYVPGDLKPSQIGIPSSPLTKEERALDDKPVPDWAD